MTARRILSALLVLTLVVQGAGIALAQDGTPTGSATPTPTPGATATATPTPSPSPTPSDGVATGSGDPTLASQTRLAPVALDKDFSKVVTVERDQQYNITGPKAVFATNTRVKSARIAQPGGRASVLDGSHTVGVAFEPDAAPKGEQSFYELELFYRDGSSKVVELYVTETDPVVVSSEVKDAAEFIETMKDDAEAHGFARTIEGISNYHEWERGQADLFNNWLAPDLKDLKGWAIVTISSTLVLILIASLVFLYGRRVKKAHGRKLRSLVSGGLTRIKRSELISSYDEDVKSADEAKLEDVEYIGPAAVHWEDTFDVATEAQLGRLLAWGRPMTDRSGRIIRRDPSKTDVEPVRDADGNVVYKNGEPLGPPVMEHEGVKSLSRALEEGDSLESTWAEPILRREHLGSAQTFLAHSRRVLMRLAERHGLQQFRPAYHEADTLLEHVNSGTGRLQRDPGSSTRSETSTYRRSSGGFGGSAAGGDD